MNVINNRHLLSLFLFFFAVWQVLSVTGCGGLGDVPSASTAESGKVTLSWNADPEATGYAVYMSTSPGVTPLNGYRFPVKENSITITALSPGMTYYFIVTALGQSGEAGRSKEMSYTAASDEVGLIDFKSIRTEAAPEPAAVQPSRQEAEKPVTLAWENVPGATSYNLYWRNQAGVTKQNGKKISNVKNPHKITGWKKGMTYYFVITAVNKDGESQESAEMSYTVP
jgi:fibronectin type 3 domain-containing protein